VTMTESGLEPAIFCARFSARLVETAKNSLYVHLKTVDLSHPGSEPVDSRTASARWSPRCELETTASFSGLLRAPGSMKANIESGRDGAGPPKSSDLVDMVMLCGCDVAVLPGYCGTDCFSAVNYEQRYWSDTGVCDVCSLLMIVDDMQSRRSRA
jgi:hypothetical protein